MDVNLIGLSCFEDSCPESSQRVYILGLIGRRHAGNRHTGFAIVTPGVPYVPVVLQPGDPEIIMLDPEILPADGQCFIGLQPVRHTQRKRCQVNARCILIADHDDNRI